MDKKQIDISYIIENLKFDVKFDDKFFDTDDIIDIMRFIDNISKSIHIDKSYVDYDNNQCGDVFLTDEGWTSLNGMMIESQYGIKLGKQYHKIAIDAIAKMGVCYIYSSLVKYFEDDYGSDFTKYITITPKNTSTFTVILCKDTSYGK